MSLCYNKLWKLLIDRGMTKTELRRKAGVTTNVLAKLGRNESVQLDSLLKICAVLGCEIGDVVELVPSQEVSA